jgi:transcription elongation GreA/GreB family factor
MNWPVGPYRIPLVIKGDRLRLAVECDGEREVSEDDLRRDMERQQTLERLGWQFVRVRGSVFARDVDLAMRPVMEALARCGINPEVPKPGALRGVVQPELVDRVRRRASEIRWMWQQRAQKRGPEVKAEAPAAPMTTAAPARVNGSAPTAANEGALPPLPAPEVLVEVGDWVEFVLLEAPNDPQLISIVTGPTDVDLSVFNVDEPLSKALLGKEKGERGCVELSSGINRELEVRQIHKPHKARKT